jgi:hypothetical protein
VHTGNRGIRIAGSRIRRIAGLLRARVQEPLGRGRDLATASAGLVAFVRVVEAGLFQRGRA